MTVMYTDKVATATAGCFLKLLARWRGSLYKMIWKELLIYLIIYAIFSICYRTAMTPSQCTQFEQAVGYCKKYYKKLNVAFVLAFYGDKIMSRWRTLFNYIPWPDDTAQLVASYVQGNDDRGRLMRRTILRYVNLSFVIAMRSISMSVRKRFPTLQHLTKAGLMLEAEEKTLESIKTPFNKYPIPIVWALSIVNRAEKERRISHKFSAAIINQAIMEFRHFLGRLFMLDFVAIPIVYTQVVTLCTYLYFAMTLIALQFVVIHDPGPAGQPLDPYVPFEAIVQFVVYMGWLKVAEVMINPFGEDDDDFDINSFIDRNLHYSYLIVDPDPDLVKDHYWDDIEFDLPYTKASMNQKQQAGVTFELGSTAGVRVAAEKSAFVNESGKVLKMVKSVNAMRKISTSNTELVKKESTILSTIPETGPVPTETPIKVNIPPPPPPVVHYDIASVTDSGSETSVSSTRRLVKLQELSPTFRVKRQHHSPFDNRFEELSRATEERDEASQQKRRGPVRRLTHALLANVPTAHHRKLTAEKRRRSSAAAKHPPPEETGGAAGPPPEPDGAVSAGRAQLHMDRWKHKLATVHENSTNDLTDAEKWYKEM